MRAAYLLFALAVACGTSGGAAEGSSVTPPGDGSGVDGGANGEGGASTDAFDLALSFDGAAGAAVTTAKDTAGHALDAKAGPGLVYEAGRANTQAIAFPGTDSALVVDAPDVARLGVAANEAFTLEIGFRTDAHGRDGEGGSGTLFERKGALSVRVQDGKLVVVAGAATLTLDAVVDDGLWHRVILTRAAGMLTATLDGLATTTTSMGDAIDGEPRISVGAGFLGAIDHLALYHHATAPFVATNEDVASTIFTGDASYASVRIPSIVRTAKGTLVVAAEGRVDNADDTGNIDVLVKRSTDGGKTWSPYVVAANVGTDKVGNPILFADLLMNQLVLLSLVTHLNGDAMQVYVQTSADEGATWTKPNDITSQVILPAWRPGVLVGPSHGVQLTHGANAGVLAVHGMHNRATDGVRGGHVWVSRDHGVTWSVATTENESAPGVEVNEGSLAELSDGRLYVNTRHQSADIDTDRPKGLRGEAFVDTNLHYLGAPPFKRNSYFRGPIVEGATFRWPGSDRYGDDARIVFSFPAGESGTNFGQRHDLRIYTSHDDASSFGPPVRLYGGKASYSDIVAIDDSRVGVIYETAPDGPDFNTSIAFRSRRVQNLDDTTVLSYGFEGQTMGTAIANEKGLKPEGTVNAVPGRLHSTAAHFDGSRLCVTDAALDHALDLDIHDGFEIEVAFRTTAHGTGGADASGALVTKTIVGEATAYWLRIEDGKVRFAVGDATHLDIVTSSESVSDGAYHVVRAARDTRAGKLTIAIDGRAAATVPITTTDVVTNADALCLGAFGGAGVTRAFAGDIESAVVRVHQ